MDPALVTITMRLEQLRADNRASLMRLAALWVAAGAEGNMELFHSSALALNAQNRDGNALESEMEAQVRALQQAEQQPPQPRAPRDGAA